MKETFNLTYQHQLPELFDLLQQAALTGEHIIEIRKRTKSRTSKQNRSLHKYLEIVSEKMNDAGVTQRKLSSSLKAGFELPVTPEMIKAIFRLVGKAMYEKDSTAKLSTVEIYEVYKVVDQRLSEVTGVSCEWPSNEPPVYPGAR